MAVAKGPRIPAERIAHAIEAWMAALSAFDLWAGIAAPHLPENPIDAMQVRLARWQEELFSGVNHDDSIMALGVIEELGEAFDHDAEAEDAVDALGDVMVYAAQLCTRNRLAMSSIVALANLYITEHLCHQSPIAIAGRLAHVVGKHEQRTRGLGPVNAYRPALVDALALMIAKALEDCTIGHELVVDPAGVFIAIGNEVMARKAGDVMIPKARETVAEFDPPSPERRAAAMDALREAAGQVTDDAVTGHVMTADPGPRI